MTDVITESPAAQGYRPPPRYRAIGGKEGSLWDGAGSDSAPLSAMVRSNLTGGELERLKWLRDRMHETGDATIVYEALAPLVARWNVEGSTFDPETGEVAWERLPPPAEAGPDVFRRVDDLTVWWLLVNAINAPATLGEARGRPSTRSDGPPAGAPSETPASGSGSPSPTPSRSSRRGKRSSSPTPAAST